MALPTSRNRTYNPSDPVIASDLNDLQDQIIGGKHGDVVLQLGGLMAVANSNTQYVVPDGSIQSTGAATILVPIPLRAGDRIKSVTYAVFGDGAVDVTTTLRRTSSAGVSTVMSGPTVTNNVSAAWQDLTENPADYTLAAGDVILLQLAPNAANLALNNIRVTYDRP